MKHIRAGDVEACGERGTQLWPNAKPEIILGQPGSGRPATRHAAELEVARPHSRQRTTADERHPPCTLGGRVTGATPPPAADLRSDGVRARSQRPTDITELRQ